MKELTWEDLAKSFVDLSDSVKMLKTDVDILQNDLDSIYRMSNCVFSKIKKINKLSSTKTNQEVSK